MLFLGKRKSQEQCHEQLWGFLLLLTSSILQHQVSYNDICEFQRLLKIDSKWARGYQMQVWWGCSANCIVTFELLANTSFITFTKNSHNSDSRTFTRNSHNNDSRTFTRKSRSNNSRTFTRKLRIFNWFLNPVNKLLELLIGW